MLTIIGPLYSIAIVLAAGRTLFEFPAIKLKGEEPGIKIPLYFMSGTIIISLYMFLLFLLKVKYSIVSISLPFLLYSFYYFSVNIKYLGAQASNFASYCGDLLIESRKRKNILFMSALLLLTMTLITVFLENLIVPIYIGDVYCMWFFKPKMIFMAKTLPVHMFNNNNYFYTMFSYPLLTSLNVAWIATCLDHWTDTIPKTFYSLSYLATMVFFYFSLKRHVKSNIAMIGTFITFTIPHVAGDITTGYVDLIVAFFGFFSIISLLEWMNDMNKRRSLYLSALFMGAAVFTHNQGFMLFAAIILTLALYLITQQASKKINYAEVVRDAAVFLAVYAVVCWPFKALIASFKLKDYWVSSFWQLFFFLPNLWRVPTILGYFFYEFFLNTYLWLYFWIFLMVITFLNRGNILSSNLKYLLMFILFSLAMIFEVFFVANGGATPEGLIMSINQNLDRAMLIVTISAGFLLFASFPKHDA